MNNLGETSKIFRILELYSRFSAGECLTKKTLIKHFSTSGKSIQRDITDLNQYFALTSASKSPPQIVFTRNKGYSLTKKSSQSLDDKDLFAILKVLLESRAFNKEEMYRLVDALVNACKESNVVKELVNNEKVFYAEPHHKKTLINFLWEIADSIRTASVVNISYVRQDGITKKHTIHPRGLIFNEYYFYLHADLCEKHQNYPTIFRVDRLLAYDRTSETFLMKRFEEGQYRQQIHFMYQDALQTIKFKFWGDSLEAVLDRLPTAKVIGYDGKKAIVQADVFGKGIVMWLLSQREFLEVLSPLSLREQIKETLQRMATNYL